MWAPAEYDTRHVAVITVSYDLPFLRAQRSVLAKIAGGWQINATAQFQTGTPCGIGTNNDFAGIGEYGSFGCGSEGQFWVLSGTPSVAGGFAGPSGKANSPKYFTADVTPPAPGTINLQPLVRDSAYGPGFQDWNVGLFKTFPFTSREGVNLQFRAEAFDFINHPNWSGPNYNPTSSQFGEVTGKSNLARQLQLSLKLNF